MACSCLRKAPLAPFNLVPCFLPVSVIEETEVGGPSSPLRPQQRKTKITRYYCADCWESHEVRVWTAFYADAGKLSKP